MAVEIHYQDHNRPGFLAWAWRNRAIILALLIQSVNFACGVSVGARWF